MLSRAQEKAEEGEIRSAVLITFGSGGHREHWLCYTSETEVSRAAALLNALSTRIILDDLEPADTG